MKALVFGSLNIDHVYQMPRIVTAGETLASGAYRRNEGGKGFNQAIALAKAGQQTCFAGNIGADGVFLRDYLTAFGVDASLIRTVEEPTGHAMIQVDARGQNAIVIYGGANRCVTPAQREDVLSRFAPGDGILLQNEINGVPELMAGAKARGLRVAFNPSPVSEEMTAWPLESVEWLILNEIEGAALSGCEEPEGMLTVLTRRYPACRVVLTLGEQGALYADHEQRLAQAAFPVRAVDTTAAGDTFTGYFLQSVWSGCQPAKALRRAACAAALAVSQPGAGASIPSADEVDASLALNESDEVL